ncbi:GntR family transcriptional regulator [Nocardioides euryhalodurans]|uniref:GntR family transcriptional regulator n=1 Tax=Nocardioides euryhalodurans TaxID=2518370 RepID=A0A4V1BDZ5_9ACTN|nr:GntR family transcriptional regulator [Nocardioides euryhalodurans]QBR92842.1 GntR family transcriptional regulator [Nocardioides euryhalodurans]
MSASSTGPSAYERPPSLVDFAAAALRHKVLAGAYAPGERLRENALAEELGISRPPLREALRLLEREGLLLQEPRKGVSVTPLTLHDVYEIFTLRRDFETLAVRVGVPVRDEVKLQRCRDAMSRLEAAARAGNQAEWTECAFDFHVSIVALAGIGRLEAAYRSLRFQMQLCMALNRVARVERVEEDFEGDVRRHRRLLDLVEAGDPDALLAELDSHGDRTFLDGIEDRLDGHSEESLVWLREARAEVVE